MAAERKRAGRSDDPPVVEPVAEVPAGKDRGGKKASGGGGFPGALPVAAGVIAAVLAFGGVVLVGGQLGPKDPYETLDAGGVHAARLFGAMDIDRWQPGFGTSTGIRKIVTKRTADKKKEAQLGDDRELPAFEEALAKWFQGDSSPGTKWRPGFDMFYPARDANDEAAKKVRDEAIKNVEAIETGAFVGAMIKVSDTEALIFWPEDIPSAPGTPKVRSYGETAVHDFRHRGQPARWYEHPMKNRKGQQEGSAVVILSTAGVKTFPLNEVAGAAAGLAFIGAFLGATFLAGGTKKALAQLAADTDSLAKGHFETRVFVAGPGVVQQIAKNVQKLSALAQTGAAAPPQVVVQEIVRAPVQEVSEGLAPSKSFQRPEELEVEATQKLCAELGNDYYDVINVDADHVGVFIADIPVRGARSSLHMASIRALFRANAKGETSPAEVLKAINRAFAIDLPRGVYVTAMYAVVNKTTGMVKVASAQHLPLVFWKMAKKASAKLQPEGTALGFDPGPVFDKTISEKTIQMEKGDRILLFTDGAINAKSPAGVQYGEERFYYVVNKEAPKNSAACVNFVANDVDLFHEGSPLLDDFTLVTVRKLR